MENKKYNQYGEAAIRATEIGGHPKEAWQKAAKAIMPTRSTQEKGCPRTAFLGLCEEGLVKGIEKGKYTRRYKGSESPNKTHAIKAYTILKENNDNGNLTAPKLWKKLNIGTKSHNGQMDVILGLWNKGYLAQS